MVAQETLVSIGRLSNLFSTFRISLVSLVRPNSNQVKPVLYPLVCIFLYWFVSLDDADTVTHQEKKSFDFESPVLTLPLSF